MARVVFFGNEQLATGVSTTAPTLQALIEAGHEVVAVVTNEASAQSRDKVENKVAEVAKQHQIALVTLDKLGELSVDIGVLVAYGKIVPQAVIDLFRHGIINIHPSLLPQHRGSTPIESAILGGDAKTGVSLMQLTNKMDGGPVYGQSEFQLTGQETKQELADQLLEIGKTMLLELLPGILDGSLVALPQDESRASYDSRITKNDGQMDYSKTAEQLAREIRAYAEWPKSRTSLKGIEAIITKAHAVPGDGEPGAIEVVDKKALFVYGSQGHLCIERLKPAGKSDMPVEAFLAGYSSSL